MIDNLPTYISIIFGFTVLATLFFFLFAVNHSTYETTRKKTFIILVFFMIWLMIQAFLTLKNVYKNDVNSFPPKIMLMGVFPAILIIILPFLTANGRQFIDSLPLKNLTCLNIVRVPVEIVLYLLFIYKAVPQLMTFEGLNFDIVVGISAPFVAYFGFTKNFPKKKILLFWNFISLGILINIIVIAIFASPSPIQKLAFDQPNVAVLNFPFSWLPTFIVPIVLFGHLVSIRQLLKIKY